MLKIQHADKELWAATTFIAPGLGETSVKLEGDGESLTLLFDIIHDTEKPKSMAFLAEGTDILRIQCINFDDHLPATLQELIEIGDFIGRRLFIIFSIVKIGAVGEFREINLSIYLGRKVRGEI